MPKPIRIQIAFESNRLSDERLAQAYELVAPPRRRRGLRAQQAAVADEQRTVQDQLVNALSAQDVDERRRSA